MYHFVSLRNISSTGTCEIIQYLQIWWNDFLFGSCLNLIKFKFVCVQQYQLFSWGMLAIRDI